MNEEFLFLADSTRCAVRFSSWADARRWLEGAYPTIDGRPLQGELLRRGERCFAIRRERFTRIERSLLDHTRLTWSATLRKVRLWYPLDLNESRDPVVSEFLAIVRKRFEKEASLRALSVKRIAQRKRA